MSTGYPPSAVQYNASTVHSLWAPFHKEDPELLHGQRVPAVQTAATAQTDSLCTLAYTLIALTPG